MSRPIWKNNGGNRKHLVIPAEIRDDLQKLAILLDRQDHRILKFLESIDDQDDRELLDFLESRFIPLPEPPIEIQE